MGRLGSGIRERKAIFNGEEVTRYNWRVRKKDPDTGRVIVRSGTCATPADAEFARANAIRSIALGDEGERLAQKERIGRVTLRELIDRYYYHEAFRRKLSWTNEWWCLKAFMERNPKLVDLPLTEIKKRGSALFAEVRDRRVTSKTDGVSFGSFKRNDIGPLRKLFKIARTEWSYPIGDPFRDLDMPPEQRDHQIHILKYPTEDIKLYKAIEGSFVNQKLRLRLLCLVQTALTTALRRGHLLKLKWKDVDWDKKLFNIPRSYVNIKKYAPPIIPMTDVLHQHLKYYYDSLPEHEKAPTAQLFPIKPRYVTSMWDRVATKADLFEFEEDGTKEYMHFNDLRHTASTRYREKPFELNPAENEYLLGHKNTTTNANYNVNNVKTLEWVASIRAKFNAAEVAIDAQFDIDRILPVEEVAVLRMQGGNPLFLWTKEEWVKIKEEWGDELTNEERKMLDQLKCPSYQEIQTICGVLRLVRKASVAK